MLNWTYADQKTALAQGWGIFDNSDYGYRIERYDEAAHFDCDAAAVAYVAVRAVQGHALERRAFEWLAWHHAVLDAATL